MKKIFIILSVVIFAVCLSSLTNAQQKEKKANTQTKLTSDKMVLEEKELDKQIVEINKNLQDVIVKYKLTTVRDIGQVPYRVSYNLGTDYLEISRYELKRDPLLDFTIIGIKERKVKVYFAGDSISKIESEIKDKNIGMESGVITKLVDPSPTVEGTDDIIFTHTDSNLQLIKDKKLGDIRNNRAFPVRNDIKREFLIPHSTFIYNTFLKIAELYYKGIKDSDSEMYDFLKKSTSY